MIDTIVLRIHDLDYHRGLAEFLTNKFNGTGVTYSERVDEETGEVTPVRKFHKTLIKYHDTGREIEKTHTNFLKSSHYNLAYRVMWIHDYIEFNFSIPKYVYGTNIIHYNTPPNSPKYQHYNHGTIQKNLYESFRRLHDFLDKFFKNEFVDLAPNKSLVEINRIDLCYNQMFPTKHEALAYMKELRNVRKKWSRDSTNSLTWETSMMHKVNGRYSIKCYHKGSEFKKNDSKRLLNKQGFDVPYYQSFADRILRYEFTIFNGYLSYLYMQNEFRKNCPIWNDARTLARKNEKDSNTKEFLKWKSTLKPLEKRMIAYYNLLSNKRRKFMLSDLPINKNFQRFRICSEKNENETDLKEVKFFDPKTYRHIPYCVLTNDFFKVLSNKFIEMINDFKLDVAKDRNSVLAEIEKYNDRIEVDRKKLKRLGIDTKQINKNGELRKIKPSVILPIINLLEHQNWAEIARSGMYTQKTLYNYKKDLEKIGITDKSVLSLDINAQFDLRMYNSELMLNTNKFKNLNF